MTFQQLYDQFTALWDETGSPYLPPAQFDVIANVKYNDWLEAMLKQFERNENLTERVRYFLKKYQKLNSDTIILRTEVPDFRRRFRFTARFRVDCGGVISYIERSVEPVTTDEIDVIQQDPFNKPTDDEPVFITDVNAAGDAIMRVYSKTVPVELNMTYVRNPQVINVSTAPGTTFELPDYYAQEVLNLIVKNADIITENFNRANGDMSEINQRSATI